MKKKEYRDRIYKNYNTACPTRLAPTNLEGLKHRTPYLRNLIHRYFPQDRKASILDLGCGYGAILYFARQTGYTNLRGIEVSSEQCETASKLGIEGVEEGDLRDVLTGLDDASQDCIVTFDVLEHFTQEELIPLVDDIFRVIKPGGRWIIHTINGESPFFGRIRYGDFTHEIVFTRISISQLLLSTGFRNVQSIEDEPIIHGVISIFRWFFWIIIRNLMRLYIAIETGYPGKDTIFSQNFLVIANK